MKKFALILLALFVFGLLTALPGDAEYYKIKYSVHMANLGWGKWKRDGMTAGTVGEKRRIEAIKIIADPRYATGVKYMVHLNNKGWTDWRKNGELCGTVAENRQVEAVKVALINPRRSVRYKVHMAGKGWSDWSYDGAMAGTTGENRRIEAIRIEVTQ